MAAGLLKALPLCGQPQDTKAPRSLLPSAKQGCAREIALRKMQATGHKCRPCFFSREETPLPANFGASGQADGAGYKLKMTSPKRSVLGGALWWQVADFTPVRAGYNGASFFQTQTVIHTVQSTPGQMFPVSLNALVSSQPHHVPLSQGVNSLGPESGRKQFSKEDGDIWGWALCLGETHVKLSLGQ